MIDDAIKALLQGKNFAAITTLLPSGQPHTNIMWVDCDDEDVLFNTEVGRQKFLNIQNDPRVTLAVWDSASPYRYAEIRGRVVGTDTGAAARSHIDQLSQKYNGQPYPPDAIGSERVIVRVRPERQRLQG